MVVGVVAFSLGAGTIALGIAGIPGADNFFHACVSGSGGVRIVPDTETCRSSETAVLIPAQAYVDSSVAAEAAARAAGDAATLAAANAYTDSSSSGVPAEAAARQAADTTLQANIDAEAAARQAADTTLQNNVNAEAAARAQGDSDVLAAANQYTDTSVQNEAAARQAADTTLQNNVNAEAAARAAADTTLQNNIDAEAAARQAADTTLQNNVNAEAAARAAGDNTLQANINNEAAARQAADTTLQNNINAEAAARAAADTSLQNQINTLSGGSGGFTAGIGISITPTGVISNTGILQVLPGTGLQSTGGQVPQLSVDFAAVRTALAYEIKVATVTNSVAMAAGDNLDAVATCSAGKVVIGGGASVSDLLFVATTAPQLTNQWVARGRATGAIPAGVASVNAFAICARLN